MPICHDKNNFTVILNAWIFRIYLTAQYSYLSQFYYEGLFVFVVVFYYLCHASFGSGGGMAHVATYEGDYGVGNASTSGVVLLSKSSSKYSISS